MNTINVTVIYALSKIQYIYSVKMKKGSTVKDAVLSSNILKHVKKIKPYSYKIGIYNKLVHLTTKIKPGDRIEIYRNLIIDPKEKRRRKYLSMKNNF